jgi:hypothetical protein
VEVVPEGGGLQAWVTAKQKLQDICGKNDCPGKPVYRSGMGGELEEGLRTTGSCTCRWSLIAGEWARDAPNSLCEVHFQDCPHCHGAGRMQKT